jgi:hypothetical protein
VIPLMIKINLLPQKEIKRGKRRSTPSSGGGGGGNVAALFGLVLIMELGGLMYWFSQAEAASTAPVDTTDLQAEKSELNDRNDLLDDLASLEKEVGKQRVVFENLEYRKVGPVNSMMFLSYALRRVDAGMQEDEYRVLADVWASDGQNAEDIGMPGEDTWNPDSIWLTKVTEKEGEVEIEGEAKEHEDVMTFLRRMKTTVYFEGVDLIDQRVQDNSPLGQTYVSFRLKAFTNDDPRRYPPL